MKILLIYLCLFAQVSLSQSWEDEFEQLTGMVEREQFDSAIAKGNTLVISLELPQPEERFIGNVYSYQALSYFYKGQIDSAVAISARETGLRRSLSADFPEEYMQANYMTALYLSHLGEWTEGIGYMREALRIHIELYNAVSPEYVDLVNELAYFYDQAGAYILAKNIYEQTLAMIRQNYRLTDTVSMVMSNVISTFYFTHGMWEEAEPFYTDAIELMKQHFGKPSSEYLASFNSLCEFYIYAGKYEKAVKVCKDYAGMCEKFYGTNSEYLALALNNLAVAYEKTDRLREAEATYLECLKIKEILYGKTSENYALTLSNLGIVYDKQNYPEKAEKAYQECLAIYREISGSASHAYGVALGNLASTLFNNGRQSKAFEYFESALTILERSVSKQSDSYVAVLHNYASSLYDVGRLNEAEIRFAEVCQLKLDIQGRSHESYGISLYTLAHLKVTMGKYHEAEDLFMEALEVILSTVGKNTSSYANALNGLGILYNEAGRMNDAEDVFLRCERIFSKVYGELHSEYGTLMNNIGQYYSETGDYDKAEKYLTRSLEITAGALGEDHQSMVFGLNNLANVYLKRSEFQQAETSMKRALDLTERHQGKDHPNYAATLRSLGVFYYELGNYDKAEVYYKKALDKQQKIYGNDNPEYATTLNNLGALYLSKATYTDGTDALAMVDSAISKFKAAYAIDSVVMGEDHPEMAFYLNNLAEAYRKKNEPARAEPLYLKSIALEKEHYGANYPNTAVTLHNLALLHLGQNNLDQAEDYALQSIGVFEQSFGKNNAAATGVIINLAYIYQRKNEYGQAEHYFLRGLDLNETYLSDYFAFLSEEEKAQYLKTTEGYNEMFATFANVYQSIKPSITTRLYNNELFYKGLLLRSSTFMRNHVLNAGDSTLTDLYKDWTDTRHELSKLYSTAEQARTMSIAELEEKANTIEKELVKRSDIFRKTHQTTDWSFVQSSLKPNEFAVEFLHYNKIDSNFYAHDVYAALIVSPNYKYPILTELFYASQIESLIGKVVGKNKTFVDEVYGSDLRNDQAICELITTNLEPYLKPRSTIYYAPSGILHKIAFSALSDSVYLSDKYQLVQLSSTAKVAEQENTVSGHPRIGIFGGAKYSTETSENDIWAFLEGTESEAQDIGKLLSEKGWQVEEHIGWDASEEQFKSFSGDTAPEILHIATHGFFYADPDLIAENTVVEEGDLEFRGAGIGVQTFVENSNPLMRSGLVFSGANDVWSKTDFAGEDGVLTAYEVADLYLDNTKLAVMSACETGLGDIQGSEGVYGLQRAFKIAGVENLIMSLWQVPDKETAEFMTLFYENLAHTHSIRQAFDVSLKIMREKYPPYYWAAFVLIN